MKTVYKYDLSPKAGLIKPGALSMVTMPRGAKILKVAEQRMRICVWALIDTDETVTERRTFHVVGTGQEICEPPSFYGGRMEHVGTFLMMDGDYVWHVFEVV